MFYIPRLFIYNTEAQERPEAERRVLQEQFGVMMRRLWYGITWPSAILTAIFGPWLLFGLGYANSLFDEPFRWLLIKLIFVVGLYGYHFSLHRLLKQQSAGIFRYSSQQLRIWNEVATIFLVAIILLVVVKQGMSLVWGLGGLVLFIVLLMSAIRIYKQLRKK